MPEAFDRAAAHSVLRKLQLHCYPDNDDCDAILDALFAYLASCAPGVGPEPLVLMRAGMRWVVRSFDEAATFHTPDEGYYVVRIRDREQIRAQLAAAKARVAELEARLTEAEHHRALLLEEVPDAAREALQSIRRALPADSPAAVSLRLRTSNGRELIFDDEAVALIASLPTGPTPPAPTVRGATPRRSR